MQLIAAAEEWRKSPKFQSKIYYDNTPFVRLGNGLEVRATMGYDGWLFKAIARDGFTGKHFKSLQETIDYALKEKEAYYAEMRERMGSTTSHPPKSES